MAEGNPEIIQQQIADLERMLQAKRAELGGDTAAPYEHGEVHEAVGERIKQQMPAYQPAPSPAPAASASGGTPSWQDPVIAQQVQDLVNIAFTQSLDAAIGAAVKTGSAALIDAFHDLLRDQLVGELIARGKFKPVS